MSCPRPVALIILDGFGHKADSDDNAISRANMPYWDSLLEQCPNTLISGSGLDVGLPGKQMGNSEVGHINLGAGRVVYQELTRIDQAIAEGSFRLNDVFRQAINKANELGGKVHIIGLASPGGVHSHESHLNAAIEAAAINGANEVYVHAFLDGRDTPPKSAEPTLKRLEDTLDKHQIGHVASLCGRYYAMDRDNRFERVERTYRALTQADAPFSFDNLESALMAAYARDETDEFVQPTLIKPKINAKIEAGDAVIFMNFRADRARELTSAFVTPDFDGFERGAPVDLADFVTLTEYQAGLLVSIMYPPQALSNVLGEVVSKLGLKQLRAAETEKYAHVTFFFNGGTEAPFPGEERCLIPSPKVATYDLQPEMCAPELTDALIKAIESGQFDLIICNYANADMVGHTGNFDAAKAACEALDKCLSRLIPAIQKAGGECLITADHGNAEQMFDAKTGQAHTAHTSEPVPLVYVGRDAKVSVKDGVLSDVAPTLLHMMGQKAPDEMTGRVLFDIKETVKA